MQLRPDVFREYKSAWDVRPSLEAAVETSSAAARRYRRAAADRGLALELADVRLTDRDERIAQQDARITELESRMSTGWAVAIGVGLGVAATVLTVYAVKPATRP